jgi:FtsH-binding integral membrane protein
MNKIWKFFQYGYLIIAAFFLYDTIINISKNSERAVFSFVFFIFIVVVFFFKRHFRKKIQQRNSQNK